MLSSELATYYTTKLLDELKTTPEYIEIRPKSKLKRLAIRLHLREKVYRAKAEKGYVLRKDIFGRTIQVPKELAKTDPTLKNYGKKITFTRYSPLEVDNENMSNVK